MRAVSRRSCPRRSSPQAPPDQHRPKGDNTDETSERSRLDAKNTPQGVIIASEFTSLRECAPGPCKPPFLEVNLTGHFTSYETRTNHELATPAPGPVAPGARNTLGCGVPRRRPRPRGGAATSWTGRGPTEVASSAMA